MNDEEMITYLEGKGYKIQKPPKEIKDEYTFERAWELYQKKVGCKEKLKRKWNALCKRDRKAAIDYIPLYVLARPDKQFRKDFQTFLNQRAWEDELIGATPPPAITNEQPSLTAQLIQKTKATITEEQDGTKLEKERERITGLIALVKANPKSSARKSLEGYYNRGYLQELGIAWQP